MSGALFLSGSDLPIIRLEPGTKVVIGRTREADVVVQHHSLSRRHAEVERRADGTVWLRDLGSTNGTFVDDRRLGEEPFQLPVGSVVEVGLVAFGLAERPLPPRGRTSEPTAHILKRELAGVSLESFLPTFRRASGLLEVTSEALEGWISFYRGKFEDAETNTGLTGKDAFRELLKLRGGRFVLYTSDGTSEGSKKLKRVKEDRLLDDLLDGP